MKKILPILVSISVFAYSMNLHGLLLKRVGIETDSYTNPVSEADAAYQFVATSQTVTTAEATAGSYLATTTADNNYMYATTTSSGLDITFTFDNVRLWNANALRVLYDGTSNSASLTYQIQIRDFANSTWRNIVPHEATYANATEAAAGLLMSVTTTTAPGGGDILVYDGYFSNGSNTAVSTPLGNFVNSNRQVQIRFFSSTATAGLQLSIDHLSVVPLVSPFFLPSSLVNNGIGARTNEYNDLTTDDNQTSVTVVGATGGVSVDLFFTNVSLPYSDANTFLLQYSGHISTGNYSIQIYDYADAAYETLNATTLTNTADASNEFAKVPSVNSDTMADFIDEANNNRVNIRITSAITSGTLTIDFARLVIGSTHTNAGIYTATATRGTTSTGTEANLRNLDTSNNSTWVLNTANTGSGNEAGLDCNVFTNQCAAVSVVVPATIPANTQVQSVWSYGRYNSNNNDLDMVSGIRRAGEGYTTVVVANNLTTLTSIIREALNPMPQQIGASGLTAIPSFTPNDFVDTVNNSMGYRINAGASLTTARTVTVDFVFMTITSILPIPANTYRFTATGRTLTLGTETNSNYRFTWSDDATPWDTNPSGSGTDVYLSFTGVTIPTGSNNIIVTSKHRWDVASTTYNMYLYDFVGATWRNINPHEAVLTHDSTLANYDYAQFEIFDGYFSNGSNTPLSTPISNFVSSGEMRLRMTNASTTADLDWDFAQIQINIDPVYQPASSTITSGTRANEYNDVYTDDGGTYFTITPVSNTLDYYMSFTNVATPPEGFNTLLLTVAAHKTTSGSVNFSVRNFTTNSWETIKSTYNRTTDAGAGLADLFSYEIGDWSNYISAGEMRIRVDGSASATAFNLDFMSISLGMSPKSGTPVTANYGAIMNGSATSIGNVDTLSFTDLLNGSAFLAVTESNETTGIVANGSMGGKSIQMDLPFTIDPSTYPAGFVWLYRAAAAAATAVITPSFEIGGFHYQSLATSFLYTMGASNALPGAADTATLTSATAANRRGWFVEPIANGWRSFDNRAKFRLFTSTGAANLEWKLSVDYVFLTYRWVPNEAIATPETQMRGGKWFNAGFEQKYSF